MEWLPEEHPTWENLPKFVLGDCGTDRFFVIHLQRPRFVAEVFENEDDSFDLEPLWIDDSDGSPAERASLLRQAADFYLASFDWDRPVEGPEGSTTDDAGGRDPY